jgi:hypothetical protein
MSGNLELKVKEDRTIEIGNEDCSCTYNTAGKQAGIKRCSTCDGSGKGKRGKVRGCKDCYGSGTKPDFDNLVTCTRCNGTARIPANICSTSPQEIVDAMPVIILRSLRNMSWSEQYLGHGLYSCVDYGSWKSKTDEQLIQDFREHKHHQLIKITREVGGQKPAKENGYEDSRIYKLVDCIVILTGDQGYSVMGAMFDELPEWHPLSTKYKGTGTLN